MVVHTRYVLRKLQLDSVKHLGSNLSKMCVHHRSLVDDLIDIPLQLNQIACVGYPHALVFLELQVLFGSFNQLLESYVV